MLASSFTDMSDSAAVAPGKEESLEQVLEELSPRYKAFVENYLLDLNGAQAYVRAGFNPTSNETAAAGASRLLAVASVKAAVERGKAQRAERLNVSADKVLQEMALLAESCIDHYFIDDEGQVKPADGAPDGCMRAIQSIKKKTTVKTQDGVTTKTYDVEIKLWDKPAPLKLMGRHVGLFPDRVEHVGKGGGPIELAHLSPEELLARHRALAEVVVAPPADKK